jgi:hypothetical protein
MNYERLNPSTPSSRATIRISENSETVGTEMKEATSSSSPREIL